MKNKRVLVLGGGRQGSIIAQELAKNHQVIVGDFVPITIPKVSVIKVDVTEPATYESLIAGVDLVVGTMPSHLATKPLQRILKYGKDFVDLSYTTFNYDSVNGIAASAGSTILFDCGFAPGIPNLIVGQALQKYKSLSEVKINVGGNALERTVNPFGYVPTWSLEDLYEEYTRPARIIYNGRVKTYHPLFSSEQMYNDEMNTFVSDGLRSLLSLKEVIPNMSEHTIRWAGHMTKVKRLIDSYYERGIPEEKHKFMFVQDMQMLCNPRGKDWGTLDMSVKTDQIKGMPIEYKMHVIGDANLSAMSKMTAFTCAAMAEVVLQEIYTIPGVHPPEEVGTMYDAYKFIFEYLSARGLELFAG